MHLLMMPPRWLRDAPVQLRYIHRASGSNPTKT